MADYRKLDVWMAAKDLAVHVYQLTDRMPDSERFNLTSQIQRSSVSVVANIAEGAGRGTDLDFARFIRIALGSLSELSALLDLSTELGHMNESDLPINQVRDLQVRLTNLLHRLERDGGRVREERACYPSSEQSSAIVGEPMQP